MCKSCGVGREMSIKKCVNEHCVLHLRKYHLKKKNDFNDFKNRLYKIIEILELLILVFKFILDWY